MISYGQRLLDERDRYAERNSELHVLCHDMLNALEYLGCEADVIHKFRSRLHNVPQCRVDEPLRRGY